MLLFCIFVRIIKKFLKFPSCLVIVIFFNGIQIFLISGTEYLRLGDLRSGEILTILGNFAETYIQEISILRTKFIILGDRKFSFQIKRSI